MATVYFGTNRNPEPNDNPKDFGKGFSDEGLANLRFGAAEVTGANLDRYKLTVAPEKLVEDSGRNREDGGLSELGSKEVFNHIRAKMAKHSRDTVVFIHGYNVSFKEALSASAKLKINFGKQSGNPPVNVVLFSWPSDGSMMPFIAYSNDRRDAAASGAAFARGFLKLADFLRGSSAEEACDQRIHLVAHSMGNYVLRHAVQEVLTQHAGQIPRVFDQIFLMAADEDDDAFEYDYKLKALPRMAKRVNVYFNNNDRAMAVSDKTKGNRDRLGDDGPRASRNIPSKVSLIDCTDVVRGIVEHSYYLDSQPVVTDMRSVISGVPSHGIANRDYLQETNRYRLIKD